MALARRRLLARRGRFRASRGNRDRRSGQRRELERVEVQPGKPGRSKRNPSRGRDRASSSATGSIRCTTGRAEASSTARPSRAFYPRAIFAAAAAWKREPGRTSSERAEFLLSGHLFAGYQHIRDLGRLVPYLVAMGEYGFTFGKHFHTPLSRVTAGIGFGARDQCSLVQRPPCRRWPQFHGLHHGRSALRQLGNAPLDRPLTGAPALFARERTARFTAHGRPGPRVRPAILGYSSARKQCRR